MKLMNSESAQLISYAKALEDQDKLSSIEFQVAFGVSKKKAKNNIALLIRTFVENRK